MGEFDGFNRCTDLFPEAVLLTDTDGLILAANRCAHRLLDVAGLTVGQTILPDLCHQPADQALRYLSDCARTRSFLPGTLRLVISAEQPVYRAEGALYATRQEAGKAQVLVRLTPKSTAASRFVALNQQIQLLSRQVDFRRRAERAVMEQRQRLEVTLSGIGDAVIATDEHSIITFLNPIAETLTGWNRDEAVGRPLSDIFIIINEETRQAVESPIERVLREGVIVGIANHTILVRKDGVEVPIDDSGAPIRDLDGKIVGTVLVFHDISERRAFEHQLQIRAKELEEEHRRKDEFLALLGHELRNPLAPIRSALSLHALPTSTEEIRRRSIEIMTRQVDHLTRLVNELLDVARIATGKVRLEMDVLEAASIIYRARELCEPGIREKAQQLSVALPPAPIYVRGDLQRLVQVIGNLLNNASKYSPAGAAIRIVVEENQGTVEITVTDNGMGISATALPRIFDVFSQSERALARSEGGLGVGLTLVRRLLEQHGGSVSAFSEGVDKGSTFRVVLPLVPAPVLSQAKTELLPQPVQGMKILIVDDNKDAVETLGELLTLSGHEVKVAHDGENAIAVAKDYQPSVIFLDIGLPGIDGYAVAGTLRQDPALADVALVALTGYGLEEDIKRAREAGFTDHVVKPVKIERVFEILSLVAAEEGRPQAFAGGASRDSRDC